MIKARIKAENPDANLKSYARAYRGFSWADMEKIFTWPRTGKLNIIHEALDRWCDEAGKRNQKAFFFEKNDRVSSYSYMELKEHSCRWANLLDRFGFQKGDRLFIFLPSCPDTYFAMTACARLGIIFCPLYASLGYEELEVRIQDARPRGILTHPDLAENLPLDAMDSVAHLLFLEGPVPDAFPNGVLVPEWLERMPEEREPVWLEGDAPLYLIYTSGSTGPPKGVLHAHRDMVGHVMTATHVLDVREDTVLWTDGDPAWVTGTVYSTLAPWLCGAVAVVQGSPFSASTWYRTLERHQVTVWYTTPVTIRKLMEAGEDLPTRYDHSELKHVATVGMSLAPEIFYWFRKHLRHAPHDTWWMSETGMICLANFPAMDIKPGAMGKPVPGIEAAIIDEQGHPLPMMTMGELALKTPWPSLMAGIWQDEFRFQTYFHPAGWFKTGDMALMDEEGYFYHQGRMDDLIKVGEQLLGPYEIERILCQHPAVFEAAVITKSVKPTEPSLKAFITLHRSFTPSARLNQEIKAFVRASLSQETPLKEVEFLDELPKTGAGKLLRRVLRARELGLPGGDTRNMQ